jgi:hypothetical protein
MTKTHILAEIRRTAVENGGKPVGRLRFTAETGIRESDWRGIHWVRWNQALEEAGFEPNQLTTGLSDDDKLDLLAGLVRELGHFPVVGELKMKARSTPGFPTEKSFRYLGGKRSMATKVFQFATQRGYEDVARLCAPFADTESSPDGEGQRTSTPSAARVKGYVYLVRHNRDFKIGRSNDVTRRRREISLLLPNDLEHVHIIETDDPEGIERYWHARFEARRLKGEWFRLTSEDVAAFKRRRYQ